MKQPSRSSIATILIHSLDVIRQAATPEQLKELPAFEQAIANAAEPAVAYATSGPNLREALEAIAELPEPNEETDLAALAQAYAEAREIATKALAALEASK